MMMKRERLKSPPIPSEIPWAPTFRAALLTWFRAEGRDYPWRQTEDPYAILVSEMMLQQTQTYRVEPKFREFLKYFPSLSKLALANFSHFVTTVYV